MEQLLTCPITEQLFIDPIVLPLCGHVFERYAVTVWLSMKPICPMCRNPTPVELVTQLASVYNLSQLASHVSTQAPRETIYPARSVCTMCHIPVLSDQLECYTSSVTVKMLNTGHVPCQVCETETWWKFKKCRACRGVGFTRNYELPAHSIICEKCLLVCKARESDKRWDHEFIKSAYIPPSRTVMQRLILSNCASYRSRLTEETAS